MSIRTYFENIADAIKNVYGTTDTLTPAEMPEAITNFNSIFQTKNLSAPISGQTTVEGCLSSLSSDLSELTKSSFGDSTNITSYTSTAYICPSDGYVKIYAEGTAVGNKVQLEINGISSAYTVRCLTTNYADSASVFVKKGMQLKVSVINGYAIFYPLA